RSPYTTLFRSVQPVEARSDRATDLLDLFACLSVRLLPLLLAFRRVSTKSERCHLAHEVRRQEVEERLVTRPFRFHEEGEVGSVEALLQKGAEHARIAAVERQGNVLCQRPVAPAQCWCWCALLEEQQQRVISQRLLEHVAERAIPVVGIADVEEDAPVERIISQPLSGLE